MAGARTSLSEKSFSGYLIVLAHVGFVLSGVVTTMLGLLLPLLSAKWSLNDTQAGNLFTAQFVGSIIGASASSRLAWRFGKTFLLVVGFALMAAGVAGLNLPTWAGGLVSIALYGIGLGLAIPTTNLLVSEAYPERRAAALNILNFAWSAGAVLTPFVFAPLLRNENPQVSLFGLSLALGLFAVFSFAPRAKRSSQIAMREERATTHLARERAVFIPIIAALFFIYVGAESAVGGWSASYALRLDAAANSLWTLTPSVFWAAILLGRALAPTLLRFIATERFMLFGLAVATIGVAVLLLAESLRLLFIGVFLAGFGFAPVFPSLVAILPQCFRESAPRISGYFFAVAPFGGATIPLLTGWVSNRFASLRIGLIVVALSCLIMLVLQLTVIFLLRELGTDEMPNAKR